MIKLLYYLPGALLLTILSPFMCVGLLVFWTVASTHDLGVKLKLWEDDLYD